MRVELAGELAAGSGAIVPDDARHERAMLADLQPHDAFRRQRLIDDDTEARTGEIGHDARHAVRTDRLDLAVAMREVARLAAIFPAYLNDRLHRVTFPRNDAP